LREKGVRDVYGKAVSEARRVAAFHKADSCFSLLIFPRNGSMLQRCFVVHLLGSLMLSAIAVDYLPILVFLGIAVFVAAAAVGLSFVLAKQKPDAEKLSPYECGFPPFSDAHAKFDVRFYLVSILFIIFDLEVAFLFPWAVALGDIGLFGFFSMILFLTVLTVGFVYEWKKGALEWE
jgi:NADH-quinone oxidoreductase subunit A